MEEVGFEELKKKSRSYIELKTNDDKRASYLLEKSLGITDYRIVEQGVVRIYERLNESAAINRMLSENGVEISGISVMNDTLEDYFLQLTDSVFHVS